VTTTNLTDALSRFGLTQFRDGQRDIIEAVLAGRDVLAVLPTGGGKSLCYQLPAAMDETGLVVVVSPLIALMKDQVDRLRARGIPAACLHSGMSEAAQTAVWQSLPRLLYMSPERLARVAHRLRGQAITALAVDEAHCISEWGHDFRPAFRGLGTLAAHLEPRTRLAVTATATPRVRHDIVEVLGLRQPFVWVGNFFRANLYLEVRRLETAQARMQAAHAALAQTAGAAVCYVATREDAAVLAAGLRERGERAAAYHAGMRASERHATQEAFVEGRLRVVVATSAFGMGIDKADVRLVLHVGLPPSPEAYYQEVGRAGRDGARSRCLLLWSDADIEVRRGLIARAHPHPSQLFRLWQTARLRPINRFRLHHLPGYNGGERAAVEGALEALETLRLARVGEFGDIEASGDEHAVRQAAEQLYRARLRPLQLLRRMHEWASSSACRHGSLAAWFEGPAPLHCGMCDNCARFENSV
jgi:ATP-dependent DNA helicase RecQ